MPWEAGRERRGEGAGREGPGGEAGLIGAGAIVVIVKRLGLELQPHAVGEPEAVRTLALFDRTDHRVPGGDKIVYQ